MKFRIFTALAALVFCVTAAAQAIEPPRPDETYGESQKGTFGDPSKGTFGKPEDGKFGGSRYKPPSRVQAPGERAQSAAPPPLAEAEDPEQKSGDDRQAPPAP